MPKTQLETYFAANIATEEGNGKRVSGCAFMCVVDSVAS